MSRETLKQSGFAEIRGYAWSGRGKIKAVDISFDGGVNWERTELKGLVLSKALTQFSYGTTGGQPWLLQSRAIDETGYVQPTLKQLRDERGGWSIYKNSIHTWNVMENGDVFNVQISEANPASSDNGFLHDRLGGSAWNWFCGDP